MRKGLLSSVATALVGAGSALAQNPYYVPTDGQTSATPALLSVEPLKASAAPAASPPPTLSCGSTGLVPGVDCLPAAVPAQSRFYGDVSYMLTWVKNGPNPGPLAAVAPAGAGLFGPGTAAVIGGQDSTFNGQSGIRANVGMWLGCDSTFGIEAGGFVLEQASNNTAISSDGGANSPILARPFVNLNVAPAALNAILVGGPGLPGSITERETTRLWGAEANGVLNWRNDCQRRVDLLAGFSYTDLRETIGVSSTSSFPGAAGIGGFGTTFDDAVDARNQFYAGQVGARSTWTFGKLSLVMTGKIALGVDHETVDRFGNTSFSFPGVAPITANTGFLTQSSNAGRVSNDRFAVGLPSQILLGYQVTEHLNAFLGYDFIYISSVARPGDQIDLTVQNNPTTGASIRPVGGIHSTDFWANSLLAGLSFKY